MNDDADAKWQAAVEWLRGVERELWPGDLRRCEAGGRAEPSSCHCGRKRWVCEAHPAVAFDECSCGAQAAPCVCNPDAELPAGWVALRPSEPQRTH